MKEPPSVPPSSPLQLPQGGENGNLSSPLGGTEGGFIFFFYDCIDNYTGKPFQAINLLDTINFLGNLFVQVLRIYYICSIIY